MRGLLEYKCRSCGGCFQPTEVDDAEEAAANPIGQLFGFHLCPSGIVGIADLVGVVLLDRARTLDSLVDKFEPLKPLPGINPFPTDEEMNRTVREQVAPIVGAMVGSPLSDRGEAFFDPSDPTSPVSPLNPANPYNVFEL